MHMNKYGKKFTYSVRMCVLNWHFCKYHHFGAKGKFLKMTKDKIKWGARGKIIHIKVISAPELIIRGHYNQQRNDY